ncbi:nucleotidyl transferase AbiEii/AbiGii toxin family protein [Candidatus Peregrinibacteria bacterium]|nr:nucleotidyl transferase AbiEii/AbiGii toxin family protein [Candidatus Peregrinibacteria bacterium]
MAQKTILSGNQRKILQTISLDKLFHKNFYLTGGTALAEFYLMHRLSEDLDFFSEKEFDSQAIFVFFKKNQKALKIKKIDYQQSFNRNLFFLHLDNDTIKTEFTYFPFPRIETAVDKNGIAIDSVLDIAVNKVFTIYQKARARDFIDLYFIIKKYKFNLGNLIKKAKIKFDWHIDPIQLGSQFFKAQEVKDFPRMIAKEDRKSWQKFFLDEAKSIGNKILT